MDKLKLAHEWALVFTQQNKDLAVAANTVSKYAFDYADAMQAEADKRKPSGLPEALREEWQPDWSQAPTWANYWVMNYNGICYWTESQPIKKWNKYEIIKNERASTFNYQGEWQNSLRERPHGF